MMEIKVDDSNLIISFYIYEYSARGINYLSKSERYTFKLTVQIYYSHVQFQLTGSNPMPGKKKENVIFPVIKFDFYTF